MRKLLPICDGSIQSSLHKSAPAENYMAYLVTAFAHPKSCIDPLARMSLTRNHCSRMNGYSNEWLNKGALRAPSCTSTLPVATRAKSWAVSVFFCNSVQRFYIDRHHILARNTSLHHFASLPSVICDRIATALYVVLEGVIRQRFSLSLLQLASL